jgi:hypothetical protein
MKYRMIQAAGASSMILGCVAFAGDLPIPVALVRRSQYGNAPQSGRTASVKPAKAKSVSVATLRSVIDFTTREGSQMTSVIVK